MGYGNVCKWLHHYFKAFTTTNITKSLAITQKGKRYLWPYWWNSLHKTLSYAWLQWFFPQNRRKILLLAIYQWSTDFVVCGLHSLYHIAGICIKVNLTIQIPKTLLFSIYSFQIALERYYFHIIKFLYPICGLLWLTSFT